MVVCVCGNLLLLAWIGDLGFILGVVGLMIWFWFGCFVACEFLCCVVAGVYGLVCFGIDLCLWQYGLSLWFVGLIGL